MTKFHIAIILLILFNNFANTLTFDLHLYLWSTEITNKKAENLFCIFKLNNKELYKTALFSQ